MTNHWQMRLKKASGCIIINKHISSRVSGQGISPSLSTRQERMYPRNQRGSKNRSSILKLNRKSKYWKISSMEEALRIAMTWEILRRSLILFLEKYNCLKLMALRRKRERNQRIFIKRTAKESIQKITDK